jgi:hypothetical protein
MKKIINNEIVDLTAEEISQREEDIANAEVEAKNIKDAETETADKKASGKQKLLDLGLSEEEVKALIGI